MDSEAKDRYESDNLIWQLDVTLKKLSVICKRNAKLVDYINTRVDKTVGDWHSEKGDFKQLSWVEMDDSDLELDLDVTLPSPLMTTDETPMASKDTAGELETDSIPHLLVLPKSSVDTCTNGTNDSNTNPPPSIPSIPSIPSKEESTATPSQQMQSVSVLLEGSTDKKDQYDSFNPFDDEEIVSEIDDQAAEPSLPQSVPAVRPRMDSHEMVIREGLQTVVDAIVPPVVTVPEVPEVPEVTECDECTETLTVNEQIDDGQRATECTKQIESIPVNGLKLKSLGSNSNSNSNHKSKASVRDKLMFVQQRLLKAEQNEQALTERKKEERRRRMQRAERRKAEQQQMKREKHEKLNSKLEEIKLLNHREKALELKKMVERQQKAERTKQRINKEKKAPMIAVHRKLKLMEEIKATEAKQREENLNKRFQNAAHKRDQIRSRKKSIDLSVNAVGASLTQKNRSSEFTRTGTAATDTLSDTVSDGEIVMEDESKLVDIAALNRLSGKFLYIPRIVRKSVASDLYSHIEVFYGKTLRLLSANGRVAKGVKGHSKGNRKDLVKDQETAPTLNGILSHWIQNTNHFNFKDKKYDREVLLVVNRMMYFDINKMSTESALSLLTAFSSITANHMALQLLSLKYGATLFRFYRKSLSSLLDETSSSTEHQIEIIESICTLMVRMLSIHRKGGFETKQEKSDRDWKRFKKQSLSMLILTLYKSRVILKMAEAFQSQTASTMHRVTDSMLSVLVEIPLILQKQQMVNHEVVDLVYGQLAESECTVIFDFTLSVITTFETESVGVISKCFEYAVNILNADRSVLTPIVLQNHEKVHEVLTSVLTLIEEQFNAESIETQTILDVAKRVLQFISVLTMDRDPEILAVLRPETLIQNESSSNSLLHSLCRLPPYFMEQKKGRNLLFPAIIGLTFGDEAMLKLLDSMMDRQPLEQWLEQLVSTTTATSSSSNGKQRRKRKPNSVLLPSRMWRECLLFYRE